MDFQIKRRIYRLCMAILVVNLVFSVLPQIDLWASALFYDADRGFYWAQWPIAQWAREVILKLIEGFFIVLLIGVGVTHFVPAVSNRMAPRFELAALIYLFGPILLVNGLLKTYWGRARPASVDVFGGGKDFTPPFQIAQECAENCSFTSGEGAGVMALFLGVVILRNGFSSKCIWRVVLAVTSGVTLLGLFLRVAMGRHFLSDTLFSVLFVVLIAALLHAVPRYRGVI
ncbi:MAG: phosphatase PAP2 family protein, partial [Pseudomonadota bacterium]